MPCEESTGLASCIMRRNRVRAHGEDALRKGGLILPRLCSVLRQGAWLRWICGIIPPVKTNVPDTAILSSKGKFTTFSFAGNTVKFLLKGRFVDNEGFTCANASVIAKRFVAADGGEGLWNRERGCQCEDLIDAWGRLSSWRCV